MHTLRTFIGNSLNLIINNKTYFFIVKVFILNFCKTITWYINAEETQLKIYNMLICLKILMITRYITNYLFILVLKYVKIKTSNKSSLTCKSSSIETSYTLDILKIEKICNTCSV